MGWFHKAFHERVCDVWRHAGSLKKPVHDGITWTSGIINARGDFDDLQTHAIALAASIVIQHDVVPKIVFGWDAPVSATELAKDASLRKSYYPVHIMKAVSGITEDELIADMPVHTHYSLDSRYLLLHRSPQAVAWNYSLGLGYRAKYLGAACAMTPHVIVSDIDTICVKPCIRYLEAEIAVDPNTFCLTNWYDNVNVSVGLCVYNTMKYHTVFMPLLNRHHWSSHRRDGTFIQHVRKTTNDPRLDIRLINRNKISTERFWRSRVRKNYWTDDTMHYHAWKGEATKDRDGFEEYYSSVLDGLTEQCT